MPLQSNPPAWECYGTEVIFSLTNKDLPHHYQGAWQAGMEALLKAEKGQNALILWASSFILLLVQLKGELLGSQCSAQSDSPPLSVRFRAPSLWGHSSHLLKLSRNNKFNLTPTTTTAVGHRAGRGVVGSESASERWGCFQGEEVEGGLRVVWVQEDTELCQTV